MTGLSDPICHSISWLWSHHSTLKNFSLDALDITEKPIEVSHNFLAVPVLHVVFFLDSPKYGRMRANGLRAWKFSQKSDARIAFDLLLKGLYIMPKGRNYLGFCIVLISGMTYLTTVQAQAIQTPGERILQQEQQRQAEERRRIEAEQRNHSLYTEPLADEQRKSDTSESCFTVREINLQGIEALALPLFDGVLEDFVGRCLGVNQLNEVLDAVSRVYFNAGYITTRAYLPEQDLSSGALTIQVIEGLVEKIKPVQKNQITDSLTLVFPGSDTEILNLRDLEQGLEQINRLRSRRATMKLIPGSTVGQTLVEIQEQVAQSWQINNSYSNSGQQSTGERQAQLMVSWDSPLGLYDYSYLSLQTDVKNDSDGKKSQSASWHWDLPIGYWMLSTDISYFEYLSTVNGLTQNFETSGKSESQRLGIGRTIHRDSNSKTRFDIGFTRKKNKNFVEDVLIETSSRTLGIASLAVNHEQYFSSGGLLLSDLAYHRGLKALGSLDDKDTDSSLRHDAPKAQFDKYTFELGYNQPFKLAGISMEYRGRWHTQYSPDVLFGSEEISIGSSYTVRGYKESSLSSNIGSYWRNDLHFAFRPQWAGDWLTRITPFIGFDAGVVRDYSTATDKYENLKGWACGLAIGGRDWSASMTFAQPVDAPDYLRNTGDEFEFSVNLTF